MSDGWRALRGDGSDSLPLGTSYDARLRNGEVFYGCCITTFCLKFGADLFRDGGGSWDAVAIRVPAAAKAA